MSRQWLAEPFGFQGEWKPQPLVLSLTNDCGQALSWLAESEGGGGFNRKANYICLFGWNFHSGTLSTSFLKMQEKGQNCWGGEVQIKAEVSSFVCWYLRSRPFKWWGFGLWMSSRFITVSLYVDTQVLWLFKRRLCVFILHSNPAAWI